MLIGSKCIGVYPPEELHKRGLLFAGLTELFPIAFKPFLPGISSEVDACVFLGRSDSIAESLGVPCYVYEKLPIRTVSATNKVTFASTTQLHKAIRGQTLVESSSRELRCCSAKDGDTIYATVEDNPVWTVRGVIHHVSVDLPHLAENDLLHPHFLTDRWLGLLPFIHFLRHVTADVDWQLPALTACFVIDDPNLHALTYGDLDFRRVAQAARSGNYHVAIATVPMDAWYVNQNVARLFKEYSRHLSLTVHGNDHTRCELTEQGDNQLSRLGHALRRVDLLEQKAGLDVSRVMVAPHEACSEGTADLMLKLGYEGMTMKLSKLLYWVRDKRWPVECGLRNVIWMGSGFPILRRFRLRDCFTQARLAAFLGQPIVAYGHHSDCSLDILGNSAGTINSIGVQWADLKSIMRSNYRTKTTGDLLQIQMGSRHIKLIVPEAISHISVERPWMQHADTEFLVYKDGDGGPRRLLAGPVTEPFDVTPGSEVAIQALPKDRVDYQNLATPPVRAWSMIRRVLVETRDRLKPLVLPTISQTETRFRPREKGANDR